jgi:hypothetical protein
VDGLEQLAAVQASRNGHRGGKYAVTFDDKKRLVLPDPPAHDDVNGLCRWLTVVFNLDPAHPVTGGERHGLRGPDGHAVLHRRGAQKIRFEPIRHILTPMRLAEALEWQALPTDGNLYGFKSEHARRIAYVVRMLCASAAVLTADQETEGVVTAFLAEAVAVEGHTTYGDSGLRYEAITALQRELDEHTGRPVGAPRYLVDRDTGELVVRVSDLSNSARRTLGASVPRGWLDARMDGIGWRRLELQGYGLPGRAGRQGTHARVNAYRGLLPTVDNEPVNT